MTKAELYFAKAEYPKTENHRNTQKPKQSIEQKEQKTETHRRATRVCILQRDLVNCVSRTSFSRHQLFYPYVTISAAQAHEGDDLHHAMSPFSLFLSPFSGAQRLLGYVRPQRIIEVCPSKTGKRRSIWRSLWIGTAFARCCENSQKVRNWKATHKNK